MNNTCNVNNPCYQHKKLYDIALKYKKIVDTYEIVKTDKFTYVGIKNNLPLGFIIKCDLSIQLCDENNVLPNSNYFRLGGMSDDSIFSIIVLLNEFAKRIKCKIILDDKPNNNLTKIFTEIVLDRKFKSTVASYIRKYAYHYDDNII